MFLVITSLEQLFPDLRTTRYSHTLLSRVTGYSYCSTVVLPDPRASRYLEAAMLADHSLLPHTPRSSCDWILVLLHSRTTRSSCYPILVLLVLLDTRTDRYSYCSTLRLRWLLRVLSLKGKPRRTARYSYYSILVLIVTRTARHSAYDGFCVSQA